MEIVNLQPKEIETDSQIVADSITAPLGKKRDVAKMINVCVRSVDNYIAEGCPHLKLSPRSVRFDLAEVKVWFKTQYGQQKRKSYSQNLN